MLPTPTPLDPPILHQTPDSAVLVACLCAEWCGVCRDYRSAFEQVKRRFPQARFLWVDVEDQADLIDPIDVENFPTLLIAVGNQARFFGTMTPQADNLERMIRDRTENADRPTLTAPDVAARITPSLSLGNRWA